MTDGQLAAVTRQARTQGTDRDQVPRAHGAQGTAIWAAAAATVAATAAAAAAAAAARTAPGKGGGAVQRRATAVAPSQSQRSLPPPSLRFVPVLAYAFPQQSRWPTVGLPPSRATAAAAVDVAAATASP